MASLDSLTPDLVERRYPSFHFYINSEWVEEFFQLYLQEPSSWKEGEELPYSFFIALRDGEFMVFKELGLELNQLLHTTQKLEYHAPCRVGDWIESRSGLKRISQRKSGGKRVVIMEMYNDFYREDQLLLSSKGTVFVRAVED